MNGTILANFGVRFRSFEAEWRDRKLRSGKKGSIPAGQYSVPHRERLNKDLSDGQRAGEEPVISMQHPASQVLNNSTESGIVLEQVNE